METTYIQFSVYGDRWKEVAKTGNFIFKNRGNLISNDKSLAFLVFHYLANYNLDELEYFFIMAGFPAFLKQEIPADAKIEIIDLPNRKNVHRGWFGGITDDRALNFLKAIFGENSVSEFLNAKENKNLKERCNQILLETSILLNKSMYMKNALEYTDDIMAELFIQVLPQCLADKDMAMRIKLACEKDPELWRNILDRIKIQIENYGLKSDDSLKR